MVLSRTLSKFMNDLQAFCQNFLGMCPAPATSPLNLTNWFAKPKPNPLPEPKKPSGKRLKVLHISDFHLDPSTSFYVSSPLRPHRYILGKDTRLDPKEIVPVEDHVVAPTISIFKALIRLYFLRHDLELSVGAIVRYCNLDAY